ncbi:hypothetical protein [Nocardia salmonicida]|uniref:hypothetical protein n=1 Tax=Nocardia salmonicida TaxID=53431 RepID=UPI003645EB5A
MPEAQDPVPLQRGSLDLSVDLSVPDVYSGSDFTVYLHVKNPFEVPIWIRSVELSLPTRLESPSAEMSTHKSPSSNRRLERTISKLRRERRKLHNRLVKISGSDDASNVRRSGIDKEIGSIDEQIQSAIDARYSSGLTNFGASSGSRILYHGPVLAVNAQASADATIEIFSRADGERVALIGSLPLGVAVEPGCNDVWTILLRTSKNVLFLPAKFNLQFTVIYQTVPLENDQDPQLPVGRSQQGLPRRYSNTTSLSIDIKTAMWKVMIGAAVGGFTGSFARILQNGSVGPGGFYHAASLVLLSVILSGTAIIFAARKSDTPSFVTVEDFWGGVLVGFLIGYSGTSAFSELTGAPNPTGEAASITTRNAT